MSILAPCVYQENCSGCDSWTTPLQEQLQAKQLQFMALLEKSLLFQGDIEVLAPPTDQLRDRLDFSYKAGQLGLYKKNTKNRELVDLATCAVLNPELLNYYQKVRSLSWPIERFSLRLRRGFNGLTGAWIDAANVDIKTLLDESGTLEKLSHISSHIEVGQRGKSLVKEAGAWKLRDPKAMHWFSTFFENKEIPINSYVSTFTQPSMLANRLFYDCLGRFLKGRKARTVVEFGSGIGNFTLPLIEYSNHVYACEMDERALTCLETTLAEQGLTERCSLIAGDFQKNWNKKDLPQPDLALVNPPRSGLKDFSNYLLNSENLQEIVYISCFPETFIEDCKVLKDKFAIKRIAIIDQFPHTKHFEVMALLERHES